MRKYPLKITKKILARKGLSIIELVIAMVISAIVMLAVGFVVADAQRAWGVMYNRAYSAVTTDSYIVTKTFDALVRKASGQKVLSADDGSWIEIYYPADANTVVADRYARFTFLPAADDTNGQITVEYGQLDPEKEALNTQVICENVSACLFKTSGRSAQMMLTLSDGSQTVTVVSSAYMNNQ
jgi:prepilin-type N-terminal cleavage/methylation domain-containing protein